MKAFSGMSHRKKVLFIIVELELIALLLVALFFVRHSRMVDDIDKYAIADNAPEITAEAGNLIVDSVSVKVPSEDASYTIGYDWSEEDKDYPTVPTSASAYYTGKSGAVEYEAILYRNRVLPKERDNSLRSWDEQWKKGAGENAGQEAYETPDTKGYLIRTNDEKKYCSYAYYFPVETDSSIEQYVLEMNFYSSDSIKNAEKLFKSIADSITTSNSTHS